MCQSLKLPNRNEDAERTDEVAGEELVVPMPPLWPAEPERTLKG